MVISILSNYRNVQYISLRNASHAWTGHINLPLRQWQLNIIRKPTGLHESTEYEGFPASSEAKESTCNVGDMDLIPGLGKSPGEGNREWLPIPVFLDLCGGLDSKEFTCNGGDQVGFLNQEDPLRRVWQPTPVFLPREFHGKRSLVGYSPWGRKETRLSN